MSREKMLKQVLDSAKQDYDYTSVGLHSLPWDADH